ncbi:MAG: 5'/3'-nucleotidase SurE [Alistipes sp.]|nr:5'/3'-nucleotidase SurE [Alistipes sp.]
MDKPLIFITNDDGVNALGFRTLVETARRIGNVIAIAPETTQSGKAHAITMYSPLYLRQVRKEEGVEVYACSGTPVDCVKMAFDHLLADNYPDLTLSGINHGSNSAISVIYSGTMGAAIEASFYNRPSIGFSLDDHSEHADFSAASEYAEKIIRDTLAGVTDLPLCLNVNIPAVPYAEIKGIKICRQNRGFWKERFVCRQDPRGADYYWLTGEFFNSEPHSEDTDEWALKNGYISIVPIQTDLTNYAQMDKLALLAGDSGE